MKKLIVIVLTLLSLNCIGQGVPRHKLLDRAYYIENQPGVKIFGEKSSVLKQKYDTDFLAYGNQYMQVYNYATYYRWFFRNFKTSFADYQNYEKAFRERDTKAMFSYIAANRTKIDQISEQKESSSSK